MSWKKKLTRIFLCVMPLLLAGLAASWIVASNLVAPANCDIGSPPPQLPVTEFRIRDELGTTISGWQIKRKVAAPVLVLLHPLRGNRRTMLGRAALFHDHGYSIVIIDLQSHGESRGEGITMGHLEKHDVAAVVQYVRQNFPGSKIGVVGWSLGGAAALLAPPLSIDALVLESVYPTIEDAVYNRVAIRAGVGKHLLAPLLLAQLPYRFGISANELKPIDFMQRVDCPVLLLGGDQDLHTPVSETKAMYAAASEPRELLIFNGAAHEDLLQFDSDLYESEVVRFLGHLLQ